MKAIHKYAGITLFCLGFLTACVKEGDFSEGKFFSGKEIAFYNNFRTDRTCIYTSGKDKADTISFRALNWEFEKVRNFPLGFYDKMEIAVWYDISKHSYHKIHDTSVTKGRNRFLLLSETTDSVIKKKVSFLGLSFDRAWIDSSLVNSDTVIIFSKKDWPVSNHTSNTTLNSFTYSFRRGIVAYTDVNGGKWTLAN